MTPSKGNPIVRYRVDKELLALAQELADKRGTTISDLSREGLRLVIAEALKNAELDLQLDD